MQGAMVFSKLGKAGSNFRLGLEIIKNKKKTLKDFPNPDLTSPEISLGGVFDVLLNKHECKKGVIWGINVHSIHKGEVLFFSSVYI